jgi:hypothetical protein
MSVKWTAPTLLLALLVIAPAAAHAAAVAPAAPAAPAALGAPAGTDVAPRYAVRGFVGLGTADFGGLDQLHLGVFGHGTSAFRLGVGGEWWLARRIAAGGRLLLASDNANLGPYGAYRESFVAEPSVTVSAARWRWLDLVASGGVGVARVTEGLRGPGLFSGDEYDSTRHTRLAPTASVATGVLITAGHFSASLLGRLQTIGGRHAIASELLYAPIESNGLSFTVEAGAGLAF